MPVLKKVFLPVVLIFLNYSVHAWWGTNGHRIVGQIAENHLSKKARNAIQEILGTESPGLVSNWADFIKSDTSYNYLNPWHYINLKKGLDYEEFKTLLVKDTSTDAYTKLSFLVSELKRPTLDRKKKLMYLKLLIHIVGDVHQPMHVSRAEDQGGNRIKVIWFNDSTNLHSVWDDKLLELQKLSYTEYAISLDHTSPKERKEWQEQPITSWFYESYTIAGQLYNEITQPNQRLSYRYNYDHVEIMNRQLLKAGIRLAGLLNDIFS